MDVACRIADEHGSVVARVRAAVVGISRAIFITKEIHIREPVIHAGGLETADSVHHSIL